ncbi:1-deoxy-D-xylulose-5-phosphate synthase [Streptomyces rapamycinicus]|uniref:1-deoxy-D-xylulose-5-phosphate synthase n=2 Tax=Streptomyces rapamycinicus TaxID=1226757 RepID=A0A0A0NHE4_STRRN|nr:1-deoxy-D-xylulose-5-phosphate synthase [Streptomyces rapamycinicus]AGP53830.1 1-deoxy-D-xylulose-5-phosphate synthase [Streptomyces rapamycinicus NRRL 5491]MBB4781320.1 1-deoxy-D-xylulose-5-phosphate synthase [Streptomyces rapamycinicus]RLV74036.1 1-deoxy-D-xylulose-5-phosphate synthase [Streptomyces rapamycinicus NRRL 5491]UTO61949.1 1-deoxy-D-xylulose-5-phosphate synthase [Streptomyces rapamycinicus]UTP29901.1 1-deoxy-D-xylulose-5-phosphate synthase [Streptomyces rapamycinicus NRRL 5491]
MPLLENIRGPHDLKALTGEELAALAQEIREFLIEAVARTGGHLGPNLGVVELSIALHRVFDSPADRILWDTGHQSYVHKLLTGRQDFSKLRHKGGLSGYPSRAESEHDIIENSHASTVLGWADGLAKANEVRGRTDHVVAVIGDGALTGGMAWEALNNIAAARDRPLVIVVNDNERSYSPTIGGLANHLATLRTTDGYERFLAWGKDVLQRTPVVGQPLYGSLHGAKKGFKDAFAPQGMFEDLGLKYVGPIDGHDTEAVESALRRAMRFHGPVLVHCLTEKGRGYPPALEDEADHFHTVAAMDPLTCAPLTPSGGRSWTSVFGEEMVRIGAERPDVVALTAAMLHPVGLAGFAAAYPERVWDVGIAEQHAAVSAAGLATGGLHPVLAVYATFLNRAFDQLLMDVALHKCGVTFVLDRAGVTGTDGPSHNGMWDMSVLQVVPGLRIAAPRDADQLRAQLREAVDVDDAPTVIRFPKESVGEPIPAIDRVGGMDVLRRGEDVLLVAAGVMAPVALRAAELLAGRGIGCTVVDPRWVKPVDPGLPGLAARHRLVAVVEDNVRTGGVGAAVAQTLRDAEVDLPVRTFGIPEAFLAHAKRGEVLADIGLTPAEIAGRIGAALTRIEAARPERASALAEARTATGARTRAGARTPAKESRA